MFLRLDMTGPQQQPVTAAAMRRSAGKIATSDEHLTLLEKEAYRVKELLGSGKKPAAAAPKDSEVSGILAKDIEAHRIKFAGSPAFDPSPVLPPTTRTWYQSPLECSLPVDEYLDQLPYVQVRWQPRKS